MKVFENWPYNVYVYKEVGSPHHLSHCDVRWDEISIKVGLPSLNVIVGSKKLPKRARKILEQHLDELCEAWDKLNAN